MLTWMLVCAIVRKSDAEGGCECACVSAPHS